jgi:hypothetical protein
VCITSSTVNASQHEESVLSSFETNVLVIAFFNTPYFYLPLVQQVRAGYILFLAAAVTALRTSGFHMPASSTMISILEASVFYTSYVDTHQLILQPTCRHCKSASVDQSVEHGHLPCRSFALCHCECSLLRPYSHCTTQVGDSPFDISSTRTKACPGDRNICRSPTGVTKEDEASKAAPLNA